MKKVLPIAEPKIVSYLHHAYQTSIIGNDEKAVPWILSHYIQLYYDGNKALPVQFYMPDETGYTWNITCPWLDVQVIKKETLAAFHTDIINFIIHAVKNDSYVFTYVNEKYIPYKTSYQKKNYSHMFMIYGYDLNKQVFHHLGYNNRVFGSVDVKFSDFKDAYYNNPEYIFHSHDKLCMIQLSKTFCYDFNVNRVYGELQALLHSKRQQQFNDDPNHVFGLDVYKSLEGIVEENLQNGVELKIQPFLLLAEHKKLMQERLKYMNGLKLFDSLDGECNRYRKLEQRLIAMRNLALLYNRTKRVEAMRNLLCELDSIRNEEADILELIIQRMNYE
ncbi:hypothetical protein [Paenibacillus woosongensis]|uniref:Butirosin biosynthesis protein H N-terminal domain-containing protein n=1 Tax=Paenibacillus woosongensis TaxID=307580 RepID=A0ABQ4MM60_9BACL|nr:hypothetical protein [Paenibacillus woosongensis]GIP56757.1 hypothetical protein J15TS10_05710 [Paenibacillus woosongensis]